MWIVTAGRNRLPSPWSSLDPEVGEVPPAHQMRLHQPHECERTDHRRLVRMRQACQQKHDQHDEFLRADRVLRRADELADRQGLLDPVEIRINRPLLRDNLDGDQRQSG